MIDRVDVFVYLDDVQFIKREWKNRNRIRKTATGYDTKWLTVPIVKRCQHGLIKDALISQKVDWVSRHVESLKTVYRHSPYFDKYFPNIEKIIRGYSCGRLSTLNIALINYVCGVLTIKTEFVESSRLRVGGRREEKLLNICKKIGADHYLANNATSSYVPDKYFEGANIGFEVQNYRHPQYTQVYKGHKLPFISNLSIVDLLFNCGREGINIIRKGNPRKI
ncbi:MAG: WbqC family protein [Deltaproteobacteria bacterium]|nr:WbqC family protein [Deltaproteobacteria bacterium]